MDKQSHIETFFAGFHRADLVRGPRPAIGGVCALIARITHLDPVLVRVCVGLGLFALSLLGSTAGFLVAGAYVLAWLLLPDESDAIPLENILTLKARPVDILGAVLAALLFMWALISHPSHAAVAAIAAPILLLGLLVIVVASRLLEKIRRTGHSRSQPEHKDRAEVLPDLAAHTPAGEEPTQVLPHPADGGGADLPRARRQGPDRRVSFVVLALALCLVPLTTLVGLNVDQLSFSVPLFTLSVCGLIVATGALFSHVRGRNGGWMTAVSTLLVGGLVAPLILAYSLVAPIPGVRAWADTERSLTPQAPHVNRLFGMINIEADPERSTHYSARLVGGEVAVSVPSGVTARVRTRLGTGAVTAHVMKNLKATGTLTVDTIGPRLSLMDATNVDPFNTNYVYEDPAIGYDANSEPLRTLTVSSRIAPLFERAGNAWDTTYIIGEGTPAVTIDVEVGAGAITIDERVPFWEGTTEKASDGSTYLFQDHVCPTWRPSDCEGGGVFPGTTSWGMSVDSTAPTITPRSADAEGNVTTGEPIRNPLPTYADEDEYGTDENEGSEQ
ncbi:MAG: PspC domain-containing protein [Actinomycetaceae bacterium]|nr:PspC domain-containing protein [Actinomycetaceae bacterium]